MGVHGSTKRLVIVTSIHPDFDKRVWRHARGVADMGWEVDLVCPWNVPADERVDGVRFRPFPPVRSRHARLLLIPWRVLKAMRPVIRDADVVHFHDLDLLPWMSLVSLYRPVVYDVHENYPDEMLVREWILGWTGHHRDQRRPWRGEAEQGHQHEAFRVHGRRSALRHQRPRVSFMARSRAGDGGQAAGGGPKEG